MSLRGHCVDLWTNPFDLKGQNADDVKNRLKHIFKDTLGAEGVGSTYVRQNDYQQQFSSEPISIPHGFAPVHGALRGDGKERIITSFSVSVNMTVEGLVEALNSAFPGASATIVQNNGARFSHICPKIG